MWEKNAEKRTPEVAAEMTEMVRAWAAVSIKKFRGNIKDNKMSTKRLYRSFVPKIVTDSDGFPLSVEIGFLLHGRFVDMGVGKGFTKGKRRELGTAEFLKMRTKRGKLYDVPNRKPKQWYSRTAFSESRKLQELILSRYGEGFIDLVETGMNTRGSEDKAKIEIKYK